MIELNWAPGIHLFFSCSFSFSYLHTHTQTHIDSASAGDGRPMCSGHLLLCWLFPHGLPETPCGSHSLTKDSDRPVNRRRHLGKQHRCIKRRADLTRRETTDDSVYAHFKKTFTSFTLKGCALNASLFYLEVVLPQPPLMLHKTSLCTKAFLFLLKKQNRLRYKLLTKTKCFMQF